MRGNSRLKRLILIGLERIRQHERRAQRQRPGRLATRSWGRYPAPAVVDHQVSVQPRATARAWDVCQVEEIMLYVLIMFVYM